jgi:hypothetical protein
MKDIYVVHYIKQFILLAETTLHYPSKIKCHSSFKATTQSEISQKLGLLRYSYLGLN